MRSSLVFSSLAAITLAFTTPALAQQAPAGTPSQQQTPPGQMPGQMPQAQTPARVQMPPTGQTAAQGQAQQHKLSKKDRNFAEEAAMGGMAEVELGKLAQQNAQNDDVKQFGTRMVQDHTNANQQLTPILSAKDVTAPTQLDASHRRTHDRLSKMRGAEFDRAYMRDMVQDHEKDVKKFRQEAEHGNDPDLKAFAQQTLPVLEQHLKLAQDTSKSLTAVGSSNHAPAGQAQGSRTR
jgi:putative membrane protein